MPRLPFDEREHAYYDHYARVAGLTRALIEAGVGRHDKYKLMQVTAPEKLAVPVLLPYMQMYISGFDWTKFEPLSIEQIVYYQLSYAGRVDRAGYSGSEKRVEDLKSRLLLRRPRPPGHGVPGYAARTAHPPNDAGATQVARNISHRHAGAEGLLQVSRKFSSAVDGAGVLIVRHYGRRARA
jgi:hypothetical protein